MDTSSVIIHARFSPNGTVVEIGERPAGLTPQEWFDFLATNVGETTYQALSGGRGVFRLQRDQVDSLKAATTSTAA